MRFSARLRGRDRGPFTKNSWIHRPEFGEPLSVVVERIFNIRSPILKSYAPVSVIRVFHRHDHKHGGPPVSARVSLDHSLRLSESVICPPCFYLRCDVSEYMAVCITSMKFEE
jgi:hypothetical protein